MDKILYTVQETAEILLTNKTKVYELINTGQLGYVKIGCIKVPRAEIDSFVEKNTLKGR